ncbi:hypothetical protein [Flavobacterium sp. FlaQc-28]|uniref:hypothetical protein n=1 Tax=Flavobacterium sp. FlaQc-28 TaxID=3374178 RepID=UPI003756E511
MSNKNNNAAAEAVAALQKDYDVKLEAFNALDETTTEDQKKEAQTAVNLAKEALENAVKPTVKNEPKAKEKLIKGKFLLSPTGVYGLAYNAGEEASLPELQANELDEAGYFKIGK